MRKLVVSLVVVAVAVCTASVRAGAAPPTCAVSSLVEHCETWADRYGTPPTDGQYGTQAIAMTPDGSRVVTAGQTPGSANGFDFLVVATDTVSGARRWLSTYDGGVAGGGDDQGVDVAMSPDGTKVFVTGQSERALGNYDYATVAFDVATGARLWAARYNGPANSLDMPAAVAVSSDGGRLFVTGYSQLGIHPAVGVPIYAATTVAYDTTTGAQQWQSTYQGQAGLWDIPTAVAATPNGVYITARSNGASTSNDATDDATVAYDPATGVQVWASRYDSGTRDYPYSLSTSADGTRVYVTGDREWNGFGGTDAVTLAYDAASGALAWSQVYATAGGFNEMGLSVTVSPSGDKVFVTGFGSDDITPVDRSVVTIAYSSSGQQLWVSRHTSPGGEAGGKVAVGPDGQRLYVTGVTVGQAFGGGVGLLGVHYLNVQTPVTLAYDTATGAVAWASHFAAQSQGRDLVVSLDSRRVFVAAGGSEAITIAYDR